MGPHLGSWQPGRTNALLLLLQVGLALQAASRGMDYTLPRPPLPIPPVLTVVEAALPLPVWGVGFLLAAGAVMVGLAGGWWMTMVVGHASLFALHVGFSIGMLRAVPALQWPLVLAGLVILAPGLLLVLTRWRRANWLRFGGAMLLLGAGGWTTAVGLGYDFRAAIDVLIAGIGNASMALGITWVRSVRPGRGIEE